MVANSYVAVKLYKNGAPGDQADKVLILSLLSRVNSDSKGTTLRNRENKACLIELIFQ